MYMLVDYVLQGLFKTDQIIVPYNQYLYNPNLWLPSQLRL